MPESFGKEKFLKASLEIIEREPSYIIRRNVQKLLNDDFQKAWQRMGELIKKDGRFYYAIDVLMDDETGNIYFYGPDAYENLHKQNNSAIVRLIFQSPTEKKPQEHMPSAEEAFLMIDVDNPPNKLGTEARQVLDATIALYNRQSGSY